MNMSMNMVEMIEDVLLSHVWFTATWHHHLLNLPVQNELNVFFTHHQKQTL